ncbi:hypothetical protein [Chthonobacter albigriseus]|uniref:hypothetical protein n=1 Tax=Chthonobacter albigriseus TaxID=1683161 RepID=UPI0015EFC128|nr:hypothetical protein [Chthonobacter albigriseus]
MITRYALFEGEIAAGRTQDFRDAILTEVLPTWKAFPGALAVRVTFAEERDEGAPAYPLILAIDYPDLAAVEAALASPARAVSRAATQGVLARFFTGRIHHHVTTAHSYAV